MRERHTLWSGVASGRGYLADTPSKRLALARWNLVSIIDRTGWTADYIASLPTEFVDDLIAIMNIRDHYSNQKSSQ